MKARILYCPAVPDVVKQSSVAGWTGVMAILMSAAVVVLMLHRGTADVTGSTVISLSNVGWAILITAFACLAISLALTLYARFLRTSIEKGASEATEAAEQAAPAEENADEVIGERYDSQLLPEDERRLYEIIDEAGGEILQVKLVASGEFSKSKVTRLLDKLEDRGLIKRERHGMTNRVRLEK
jgi:uncharacterized membrane protein